MGEGEGEGEGEGGGLGMHVPRLRMRQASACATPLRMGTFPQLGVDPLLIFAFALREAWPPSLASLGVMNARLAKSVLVAAATSIFMVVHISPLYLPPATPASLTLLLVAVVAIVLGGVPGTTTPAPVLAVTVLDLQAKSSQVKSSQVKSSQAKPSQVKSSRGGTLAGRAEQAPRQMSRRPPGRPRMRSRPPPGRLQWSSQKLLPGYMYM